MHLILFFLFFLSSEYLNPFRPGQFFFPSSSGITGRFDDRNSLPTWLTLRVNDTLLCFTAGHQAQVVRIRNLLIPLLLRWFLRCLSPSQLDQGPLYLTGPVTQPKMYLLILLSTKYYLHHRVHISIKIYPEL
jgi:hypothetical protein